MNCYHSDIEEKIILAAKKIFVSKGFDLTFGARPLKRTIQRFLEDPLAEEIIAGRFTEGSTVKVKHDPHKDILIFDNL